MARLILYPPSHTGHDAEIDKLTKAINDACEGVDVGAVGVSLALSISYFVLNVTPDADKSTAMAGLIAISQDAARIIGESELVPDATQ